ncbi:hypothetical protein DSECCO2_545400 [anaerobic digester metagenome]
MASVPDVYPVPSCGKEAVIDDERAGGLDQVGTVGDGPVDGIVSYQQPSDLLP